MADKNNVPDTSIAAKLRSIRECITVEPMFAMYTLGYSISTLAMANLNLDKACRVNLKYNDTVCTALEERNISMYGAEEEAVQYVVTAMGIWKTFLQSFIPALLIPFVGSWSDRRRRRKPCMVFPLAGELLNLIVFTISTYYFLELPMEVTGFSEAIMPSITGGWMTMYMAVFSYLGDITSVETRTLRIGIANICPTVSVTIGVLVSGMSLQVLDYYGVFVISGIILFSGIIFAIRLPESLPKLPDTKEDNKDSAGVIAFIKDFFDTRHLVETMKVAFKKGEHNQRLKVSLLLVVVIVVSGPWAGEMTVMYTFTRLRFNWNELDYSLFLTFVMVINLIGTSITVGIFSHRMKMDDSIIGIISCVSKILAGFIYAFATKTWMIYLAPLVDIANGTSYIAMRSIASKLVPPDELGKLNSVFGMAEAIVPVLYAPMYNAIYQETRQTVPGAFFLVGGALTTPAIFIFLWLYKQHKEDAARQAKADLELAKDNATTSQVATDCDNEKDLNRSTDEVKQETKYNNEVFEDAVSNSKL